MNIESGIWLSLRSTFTAKDSEWADHIEFLGLSHLQEIRTIDPALNRVIEGEVVVGGVEEAWRYAAGFRKPDLATEYCLLYAEAVEAVMSIDHPRLTLLGYDLSDETGTSSLVNCGRWIGVLEPIATRCRINGLLDMDDAKLAQKLLPDAWNEDHHAFVKIWALYEMSMESMEHRPISRDGWGLKRKLFPFIN